MSHKFEQYLTNPKPRPFYQSWGSNALTPPLWWFSCPHASCPVTLPSDQGQAAPQHELPGMEVNLLFDLGLM